MGVMINTILTLEHEQISNPKWRWTIPSRERIHITPSEKEHHHSKMIWKGYVSSHEFLFGDCWHSFIIIKCHVTYVHYIFLSFQLPTPSWTRSFQRTCTRPASPCFFVSWWVESLLRMSALAHCPGGPIQTIQTTIIQTSMVPVNTQSDTGLAEGTECPVPTLTLILFVPMELYTGDSEITVTAR